MFLFCNLIGSNRILAAEVHPNVARLSFPFREREPGNEAKHCEGEYWEGSIGRVEHWEGEYWEGEYWEGEDWEEGQGGAIGGF